MCNFNGAFMLLIHQNQIKVPSLCTKKWTKLKVQVSNTFILHPLFSGKNSSYDFNINHCSYEIFSDIMDFAYCVSGSVCTNVHT